MARDLRVIGFELQATPLIYLAALAGHWLLEHTTPSWRIKNPKKGFQRIVKEERARKIAIDVLDQRRTFPNAIVLATNRGTFAQVNGHLEIPRDVRLLVVDGQHRLWAQKFSSYGAQYACIIHMGLSEVDMARLFLEINDNQKRVPSSLRWDLVRLVRPEDDPHAVAASEMIYELANDRSSPLYQRVDLTGEQKEISLKQGSLAPEIKTLVSMRPPGLRGLSFDAQSEVLVRYLTAVRAVDPDGWRGATSPFYKARVLRVLFRLLPLVIKKIDRDPVKIQPTEYKKYLDRIKKTTLTPEAIRAAQGSAGMKQIFDLLKEQLGI